MAPSTATRMCDRLVRKGLIRRYRTPADRREVRLSLTSSGKDLIRKLSQSRRDELARYVDSIPPGAYSHLVQSLRAFGSEAGEFPERDWWFERGDDASPNG